MNPKGCLKLCPTNIATKIVEHITNVYTRFIFCTRYILRAILKKATYICTSLVNIYFYREQSQHHTHIPLLEKRRKRGRVFLLAEKIAIGWDEPVS